HLNRKLTADLPHSSLAAREPIAIKQQSPLDRASILAQAGTENRTAQTDPTMKQQFSLARFREEERRRRAAVVRRRHRCDGGRNPALSGGAPDAAALARAGEPFGVIPPGPKKAGRHV